MCGCERKTICGINCAECMFNTQCKGCAETDGHPFGGECITAKYCKKGEGCLVSLKEKLIASFNSLNIPDMDEVTQLVALSGAFVNLAYPMPDGKCVKLLDDSKVYLGYQLPKKGNSTERCYGLVAGEDFILVGEYGVDGIDPVLIAYRHLD